MKRLLFICSILYSFGVLAQKNNFVEGQLLIQPQHGKSIQSLTSNQELRNQDFRIIKQVSKNLNIWLCQVNPSVNLKEVIQYLNERQLVKTVQYNHIVENRESLTDDPDFGQQWHHKNTGQTGGTIDADIDTPDAWDITTGGLSAFGDTIVACILEGNGGNLSHPDLIENAWHNYQEIPNNGIDDDGNGYIDDYNGWNISSDNDDIGTGNHGTQVASMIGAKGNNTLGISGVNQTVKLMMVRGQNANNEASVLEAYDYPLTMRKMYNATNGEKGAFIVVTNASWGVDGGNPDNFPLWCAMYDSLGKYGILNIAATTNNDDNVEVTGDMPTQCTSNYIIGVTSTDHGDTIVSSGYGTISIDLGAPGRNVYLANSSGGYGNANGTSFASPCVAGAVALMYSADCPEFMTLVKNNPKAATDSIRARLLRSVDLIPQLANKTATGGRLNVNLAVNNMLNTCDFTSCIEPFNLLEENLLDVSVRLTWGGFAPDYIIEWRELGAPSWTIENTTTDFFDLTGLTACTDYEYRVKADCGSEESNFSEIQTFKTDGCCENPILNLNNTSNTSLEINWPNVLAANSYDLRIKESDGSIWTEINDVTAPYLISDLDTCTQYDIEVKVTCASETLSFENTIQPTTTGCGACLDSTYCFTSGGTNFEYIDSVYFGVHTNGSGANGGYAVFDDMRATYGPNGTYNLRIVPGYSGFNFTERFLVFIDYDQDGVFNMSDELISNQSNNGAVNVTINTPASFTPGLTKLRVVMIGGTALSAPCPGTYYGETEDYCVILDPTVSTPEIETVDYQMYPNPATDQITIIAHSTGLEFELVSANGAVVAMNRSKSQETIIDVSKLQKGLYFVRAIKNSEVVSIKKLVIK